MSFINESTAEYGSINGHDKSFEIASLSTSNQIDCGLSRIEY